MPIDLESIKEIMPQIMLIIILVINLLTAVMNPARNAMASLIATSVIIGFTYIGGFFDPLLAILK